MKVMLSPVLILPAYKEQFLEGMIEHAKLSLRDEPGCIRFDIIQDANDNNKIWLYEVFTDDEAVEAHPKSSHYIEFEEKSKDWRGPRPQGAGRGAYSIWPPDEQWV